MSDDEPDLTPEQDREVRRLLVEARHTERMPGDVAARLDRVLAGLAGEGSDGSGASTTRATVTSLAARRRRRVTSLLVAAAAVVAVGVGLGQVTGTGGGEADSPASEAGASREFQQAPSPAEGQGGDNPADGAQESAPTYAVSSPVKVRPDDFSRDVTRAQRLAATADTLSTHGDASMQAHFACTPADWGAGTFVPVTYAGDPGVLVFRRVNGDTQVVDLFQCGSADVVRSITLPTP